MLFRNRWLPAVVLVVTVAWALAAVAMLIGTLRAAQAIDRTGDVIRPTVGGIDKDLDNVKLAAKTNQIALRILDAAEPLSGQADQTLRAARSIDKTVPSILNTAQSINDTAKGIGETVDAINFNVNAIHGTVFSIGGTAGSIHGKVGSINASVQSIGGSVRSINGSGRAILGHVRVIDSDVAGINRRASRVISIAQPIRTDLDAVRDQVGAGNVGGHTNQTIHGHANSIDCTDLLELLRTHFSKPNFRYCGQ